MSYSWPLGGVLATAASTVDGRDYTVVQGIVDVCRLNMNEFLHTHTL
jgi:hypothetical protein